ncbi:MAG: hypothetical protein B6I18_04150 [Bacteroidetes bacterium 4572_112]|nr:MAG: hypothetical protein B6I18_04150 [Bacteroidetes bacterium 4572_112]
MEYQNLIIVLILVFILNLPFGYWREGVKKFSIYWFLAVHLPIPIVVFLRLHFELGFQWWTYPFMIAAFFGGQWFGGYFRRRKLK